MKMKLSAELVVDEFLDMMETEREAAEKSYYATSDRAALNSYYLKEQNNILILIAARHEAMIHTFLARLPTQD